jgi:hypothetical protein
MPLTRPVKPTEALALKRLLNHCINDGKIADQFLWDGVAISQVGDAVRTHPDLLIRTLPDKHFEGQIKCQERRGNHERRAAFGIAKDQHMGPLRIVRPTRLASPLWSIWANRVRLRLCMIS